MGAVSAIRVTALNTYPIKSCHGIALGEARITPRGLEHDRDYMIVGDDGAFCSQRQIPEMALVVPTLEEGAITLNAPGMSPVTVPLQLSRDDGRRVNATVHGTPVIGQVVADELNEWFTTFLPPYKRNRGYRLLRVREDLPRYVSETYRRVGATNQVGFADGHAMLLASEPSLARLNTEMDAPVPMSRFRPNIVVDGPGLGAYDEDFWTELRIGEMSAFVVKACDRCAIPDVDQETAQTGKAVRRALVSRRGANAHDPSNTGVFFAQNVVHVYEPSLTLHVGDVVEVLDRVAEPNVVLRRS
jgi:uncharacterized protein YcbX